MGDTALQTADRFVGCLLGLALGDAVGAYFEGQPSEVMERRHRTPQRLLESLPPGELCYTDDTQMTIGVAETLLARGCIELDELCRRFAANYRPQRGYGSGARKVLQGMVDGDDHDQLSSTLFPGGSFGNGAAMRVAPVGLLFRHDHDRLWREARLSALPTHRHPLGIEGAQLLALAVAVASATQVVNRQVYCKSLAARCSSQEYCGPLRRAALVNGRRDIAMFGNGVDAASSVVTAIACFLLTPDSYVNTIANAVMLGGDTDTIAAMAGAISGAHLGLAGLPQDLLQRLEDRHQGRGYLALLAEQLQQRHDALVEHES